VTLVAFNLRSVILGVSPALPAIRSDLHLSFAVSGALTSLPFLCLGVFAVPGALLSNLIGPRRLIGIATATLALGAFARILQPAVLALYAGTLVVGISAAIASAIKAGATCVEMEAAALYALAQARGYDIVCLAHITNTMAVTANDFEKGEANGVHAALALTTHIARTLTAPRSGFTRR